MVVASPVHWGKFKKTLPFSCLCDFPSPLVFCFFLFFVEGGVTLPIPPPAIPLQELGGGFPHHSDPFQCYTQGCTLEYENIEVKITITFL